MKRNWINVVVIMASILAFAVSVRGQLVVNTFTGQYRLTGGGALLPSSFTIGASFDAGAALIVRGDQMGTPTQETFRTRVGTGQNQFWRMFRAGTELGRLYHGNPGNQFALQAPQLNGALGGPGILYLENAETDGIMLRANGLQAPVNTYPLRLDGFGSIGIKTGGLLNMPSRSRWQLVDVNGVAVVEPWRPYYRNGVLFSGNNDMAYIGHRYFDADNGTTPWAYTDDRSDLLISAGENDMTDVNRQRIRFTYTTTPLAGSLLGANSYNGLEFMQLWAESNTEGYFGLGDFTGAGLTPSARLDILSGKMRHRQLPTDLEMTNATKAMVVDATGVVGWRTFPTGGGSNDCKWLQTTPTTLVTALNGFSGLCEDDNTNVGIGVGYPVAAKLHVSRAATSVGDRTGILSTLTSPGVNNGNSGSYNSGLSSNVVGSGFKVRGAYATAVSDGASTQYLIGAEGAADGSDAVVETTGLYGYANSPRRTYGVVGRTFGNTDPLSRAGYFVGDLEYTGVFHQPSDEMLKENITELDGALDLIGQLRPKRYTFRADDLGLVPMNLAHGPQMGLIAQEVIEVLPQLVHDSQLPPSFDAKGNISSPGLEYKSMDYISLIPLLIGAIKELKGQVDACCAAGQQHAPVQAPAQPEDVRTERLSISPNPFTTSTTLRYYIAQEGRARLEVSDQSGRLLDVLREEHTMEGEHNYEWNTAQLASGTYFVALILDGNVVVKRAVKVGDR